MKPSAAYPPSSPGTGSCSTSPACRSSSPRSPACGASSQGKNRRRTFETTRALRDGDARRGVRRHGRAVADHPAHGNLVRARRHAGASSHPRGSTATRHPPRRRRSSRRWCIRRRASGECAFAQRAVPGFASRGRGRVGPRPELAGLPSRGGPGVRPGDFRHQDAGRGGGGGQSRAARGGRRARSAAAAARGAFETLLEPSGGTSGGGAGSVWDSRRRRRPRARGVGWRRRRSRSGRAFAETRGVHNAVWAPAFGSGANNDDRRVRRRIDDGKPSEVRTRRVLKFNGVAAVRDGFGCADTTR